MRWLRRFFIGIRDTFRRTRVERELDEELKVYLESAVEREMSRGMNRREALRTARVALGSPEALKDSVRDVGWESLVESMFRDVRYAFRVFGKSPAFSATVVLTLALGIGANTVLFSLVDAAMFRDLDVERPEQLVRFDALYPQSSGIREFSGSLYPVPGTTLRSASSLSYRLYETFRDRSETLSSVLAFAQMGRVTMTDDDAADLAYAQVVTGDYFSTLGVSATLGRTIQEADDLVTAEPVAVLSDSYWRRRFGSDPALIGKSVRINASVVTIVGVAPQGFHGATGFAGDPVDVFLPLAAEEAVWGTSMRNRWWFLSLQMMGRMEPGTTREQVEGELGGLFSQVMSDGWDASVRNASAPPPAEKPLPPRLRVRAGGRGVLGDMDVAQVRLMMLLLSGVLGMVLMIVCLNVANLLVARGAARSHEISLRTSIGASPRRIVRQLLTESAVLASIGGTLGVVIAYWGRDVFRWILPGTVNVDLDLRIDWRVLGFALVVSLATGLLFGLLPAIRARRSEAGPSLKEPGTCGTPSRRRLAQVLVSAQVAVSVTLVMGAIFFVRTLWNLSDMELGFDADNLLLFRADLGMLGYDPERSLQLYDEMVREIDALPGVVAVTTSSLPLVSSSQRSVGVELPGAAGTSDSRSVLWVTVRDNYFETIGAPVLRGRDFEPGDDEDAPRVALMNETLAGQLFPDGDAVAQRIGFRGQEVEIAGVVADVQGTRGREARGFIYTNERQFAEGARTFQIRTAVEPTSVTASLRNAARRIDPSLALFDIKTQEQQTQGAFVVERLIATSSGFFGGIALLLAAIGLYGVLSFSVTQKTRELGVRMALGADTPRVVASVIREAVWPVALGIPAGLIGGLAFGQVAETLLYGLTPVDPVTIAVAVSLMVATAALGAFLPARRAANVDPLVALRHE